MNLAQDLPRVWRASTTQSKDRKRMLRLLIDDITVQRLTDARQIVMHIRWRGGSCTDTTVDLRRPIADRLRYTPEIVSKVRALARQLSDAQIAHELNRQELRSSRGLPFTASIVQWIRFRYGVPAVSNVRPGEITVRELANRLGVSIHFVHYWIQQGLIQARQNDDRGPWWITLTAEQEKQLHHRVATSGHFQDRR